MWARSVPDTGEYEEERPRRVKELPPKQRAFVREYLKDYNGTQAAIRAGYSPRSANEQASRMLAKDNIRALLTKKVNKAQDQALVDAVYVLKGLKEVAERCMQRKPVMVREGKKLVQATDENGEGVWEFNSMGANKAFELLGKHLGLFTEKVEVTSINVHMAAIQILESVRGKPDEPRP